jgi:hypothetical protein
LDDPEHLAATNAATISHHLALLLAGTPAATERLANAVDQMMRLIMATQFIEPDAFARKYREISGDDEPEKIEDLRQRMMKDLRDGSIAFPGI